MEVSSIFDKNYQFLSNIFDKIVYLRKISTAMLNKDLIREIIIENQRFTSSITFFERDYSFEQELNYVLVGLRRSGKSYLMYQQIRHLIDNGHSQDEILYFNFEDDRLGELDVSDLDVIKATYEEMFDTKPIFFLDEIQIVDGWEKFARRLADYKYRVFITGSNAKMLSSEIATTLGGRYIIKEVFPLSFNEFLSANGIEMKNKNTIWGKKKDILKHFETYFRFGGLPEVQKVQDKRSWLSNLYNKIFFGDLIARYSIRNDHSLRIMAKKMAESVKQPTSYTRIGSIVSSAGKKVSTDTVIDYVRYMCESWLILPIENICGKLADRTKNRKYYFIDNGILNLFLTDPNTSLLENIVAINLCKRFGNGVYFYKNGVEIDFYIPESETAIQVSYSLRDTDTEQRETDALIKASKHIGISKMIIITKDDESEIERDGYVIKVIPAWKWLLVE